MTYKLAPDNPFPFYLLEPGKPDPHVKWEKGQTRPRVVQLAQKGPTCWYYAMNMLRERIGKLFPPECQEARNIEIECSSLRKKITLLEDEKDLMDEFIQKRIGNADRRHVKKQLPLLETEYKARRKEETGIDAGKGDEIILNRLKEFLKQKKSNSLLEYVHTFFHKQFELAHFQFFESMGVDREVMLKNWCTKQFIKQCKIPLGSVGSFHHGRLKQMAEQQGFTWETMPKERKYKVLSKFRESVVREAFGFKASSWDPERTIEALQEELNAHGPLMVAGYYGNAYFDKPAQPIPGRLIAGRQIQGWLGAQMKPLPNDANAHAVVVIGAEKGGSREGFIYFVNPNDESDPNKQEDPKIYVVSYQSFKENAKKFPNIPTKEISDKQILSTATEVYAIYTTPSQVV